MSLALGAPRPVFAPAAHTRRSLTIASEVCEGTFTAAGATVHVGWPPPWTAVDLHPDREWWIEWIKFYYGLDLAHAFAETGDARFVRAWQRLVDSWLETVPASMGPTDTIGRRLQNWIFAWTRFAAAPAFSGFTGEFEGRLLAGIHAQASHLQANLTSERNHRTLELYALLVVALALPELDPGGSRLAFAWGAIQQNLLDDILPDGVHREQSTHYHMVALRSFLGARENARRFGLTVRPECDERLARAVEFAMACQRPDGTIPTLSDSDSDDYRDSLALAATLLERADVRFVASDGHEGGPPRCASTDFPCGGYFVQRTPWTSLAQPLDLQRHLVFDCGPLGDGGHGHYDLLSVDVWAGRPLLVDPGRYTYADGTPDWRRWFKGTAAHNTVTVDDRDQTAYRTGKPKTPPARGRLTTRLVSPRLEVVGGEASSSEYDAVHVRHVFFVDHDYWIVIDDLRGDRDHAYDLRWHLATDAHGRTRVHPRCVETPHVVLLVDGPGVLRLEDGWVSTRYGVKHPAPVVSLRASGRTHARFVTAVIPSSPARARDLRLNVTSDDSTLVVTVESVAGRTLDRITWSPPDAQSERSGGVSVSEASWTRTGCSERVIAMATALPDARSTR